MTRYPAAVLHRGDTDGAWTTDDGYRVVRRDSWGIWEYAVYIPAGNRPRANVLSMREAREVIAALRATDNQCPNAHLVFPAA